MPDLERLRLIGWPFRTVPDEESARIWADREELRKEVTKLIDKWKTLDRSTLHLMWADLGAGKTHTLRHIERLCKETTKHRMLPVYSVMPKYVRSFLEVYQSIIGGIGLSTLAEITSSALGTEAKRRKIAQDFFPSFQDAVVALQVLGVGSELQQSLASEWLRGQRLTQRNLNLLGVTRQIRTSDDAVDMLRGLVRLLSSIAGFYRIIIMLDECQRIGTLKEAVGRDINTGLQTWYDSNPNHLTLLMSFGTGKEGFITHLFIPELLDRVDPQRLRLDLLPEKDAVRFVRDLLAHFHAPGSTGYSPFTEEAVTAVVTMLTAESGVTPRSLMKVFDVLLSSVDSAMAVDNSYRLTVPSAIATAKKVIEGLREEHEE